MDRLIAMRTFAHVVDSGSFAAAAKRLAVSPATVTHNVQLLEDYFGVRLLNRTTRKLSLTEIGRQYYDHCARILAEIEEAERFVTSSQATPRGLLRLNTSVWLAHVMAPMIPEFSASFPNVSFELLLFRTDRGAQTITQRIAVNGVVTAPRAMPEFHARQMQLAGKLDTEQIP
jgi:DNA-binding transcriptional LysR family regulator